MKGDCLLNTKPGFLRRCATVLALLLLPLHLIATPSYTYAAPQLWLPTPPGEPWVIVQGYACGTHDAWDRYSIDLTRTNGETRGAPVRAAADGTVFAWIEPSGTLLVKHGEGFYTMYTHMEHATISDRGAAVLRGAVIGSVGDRGAPGMPHLHFTAFTAGSYPSQSPRSIALSFADGATLPEIGGCNQHHGEVLKASGQLVLANRAFLPAIQAVKPPPAPTPTHYPPIRRPSNDTTHL
jgi:murein DD-endopeptidase MepM/ murein hydrolase activator NlpD